MNGFTIQPTAPSSRARRISAGCASVVSMTISGSGGVRASSASSSMPPMRGMLRSHSTSAGPADLMTDSPSMPSDSFDHIVAGRPQCLGDLSTNSLGIIDD